MVTIRNIQEFYNKTLFSSPDHNGESIYFLDKNLEKPYTGILVETAKNGNIIWWSEIVDGYQNGIEKNFNLNGQLEQISEYRNNMMLGVSKEYDQSNNLIYAAIVWNNGPVKTIDLDSNMQIINKKEDERWLRNFPIPDDFKKLLNLTDQELINYQFHYTLWKE